MQGGGCNIAPGGLSAPSLPTHFRISRAPHMIIHHLDPSETWVKPGAWFDTSGQWQWGKYCGSCWLFLPERTGKSFFTHSVFLVYFGIDVVAQSEWRNRKKEVKVYISLLDGWFSLLSTAPVNHWLSSAFSELCRHARTENISLLMTVLDVSQCKAAPGWQITNFFVMPTCSVCCGCNVSKGGSVVNHPV